MARRVLSQPFCLQPEYIYLMNIVCCPSHFRITRCGYSHVLHSMSACEVEACVSYSTKFEYVDGNPSVEETPWGWKRWVDGGLLQLHETFYTL